jgi:hypothetical protein
MNHRWFCALATAGAAVALSTAAAAQTSSPGMRVAHLHQPQLRDDEQILPSQVVPPPPAAKPRGAAKPSAVKPSAVTQSIPADAPKPTPDAPKPKAATRPEPARAVTCAGNFAKDSDHLRLAQVYGSQNITFTDVDGDGGTTLKASVLFPKDPKRRLEVLWDDDATRAGTRMIVIDGQSTWTAPKGLHLGLPLAALEKLNGKPFKLLGLGADGLAPVSDWNGGSFNTWSVDCRLGLRLKVDPKASAQARAAVTGDGKEFLSSDAAVRALKPSVGEILLGY